MTYLLGVDLASEANSPEYTSGYSFIMNIQSLPSADSLEIYPGVVLQRASSQEIEEIESKVQALHPFPELNFWKMPVPYREGSVSFLPEAEWRYFVLSFQGLSTNFNDFQRAFEIASLELEVAFTIYRAPNRTCTAIQTSKILHYLETNASPVLYNVTRAGIDEIKNLTALIRQHDHQVININGIISELRNIKTLPQYSQLAILGYFSILESLITHQSDPNNSDDSITSQVSRKMVLLNHRFPTRLTFSDFTSVSEEQVWRKMYAYRSALAHGTVPDFKQKLKILREPAIAFKLIKDAVKAVARQALLEPPLLADLKNC